MTQQPPPFPHPGSDPSRPADQGPPSYEAPPSYRGDASHQGQQPYGQAPGMASDQGQHSQPGQPPLQGQPSRGSGPTVAMVIGAIVLAVVLLVGGGYLVVTRVLGDGPGQPTPGGPSDTGAGQGELPEQPTVEVPPVVTEVAQSAGLTCHDEATTTVKVKGCYLIDKGHLVTLRFRMADDGSINSFYVTILHNDVDPSKRAAEVRSIAEPLLAELPISEADRDAISTALAGDETNVSGDTEWSSEAGGAFAYRFSKDTTTLSVGERSTDFMPRTPLTEDHQPIFDELTARGWTCETEDISITCTDGKSGKVVGSLTTAGQPNNEPRLVEFRVWFNGQQPVADEPRMVDTYEALAKAGAKGDVLAIGMRMLADGEKHFFNSDVEFYRGASYYEVSGVQFI